MGKVMLDVTPDKCAKCGACIVVCPVFKATGQESYTARGKNHLLEVYREKEHSAVFEDIFAKCLLCGACSKVCPRGLDIPGKVEEVRSCFASIYGSHGFEKYLARKVLGKPELLHGARFMGNVTAKMFMNLIPLDSGLRLKLAMFDGERSELMGPAEIHKQSRKAGLLPLVYYPGCSSRYLYPKMFDGTWQLLEKLGYALEVPEKLACCGLAFKAAGDVEAARKSAEQNITVLGETSGQILVTCGSCWAQLKKYPEIVQDDEELRAKAESIVERVVEASQFLEKKMTENIAGKNRGEKSKRVFYHDPCHLRNENDVTREPRAVLQKLPGLELVELEDGPQCCGQGGLFHLGAPEAAAVIRDDLVQKVLALKPDVITTSCAGCYMQWKSGLAAAGSEVELCYFTELVNDRLV